MSDMEISCDNGGLEKVVAAPRPGRSPDLLESGQIHSRYKPWRAGIIQSQSGLPQPGIHLRGGGLGATSLSKAATAAIMGAAAVEKKIREWNVSSSAAISLPKKVVLPPLGATISGFSQFESVANGLPAASNRMSVSLGAKKAWGTGAALPKEGVSPNKTAHCLRSLSVDLAKQPAVLGLRGDRQQLIEAIFLSICI